MFSPHHVSHNMYQVSGVMCHVSCVTCQLSGVTCQDFFKAIRLRVFNKRGLRQLVSETTNRHLLGTKQQSANMGINQQFALK